jgi:hypothetical protein
VSFSLVITRQRVLFALSLLVNLLVPWLLYRVSRAHLGESHAIMLSAAAPAVWSLTEFARSRKIDAISVVVLSGIALSLVAIVLGGSPKLLLFRESLITGLTGLVFIGSALIRRPLMYVLVIAAAKSLHSDSGSEPNTMFARARFELESYAGSPNFRRSMTVATIVFGVVAVAETAIRGALIFSLPTERALLVGPIVGYCIVGLLVSWWILYTYRAKASWKRDS